MKTISETFKSIVTEYLLLLSVINWKQKGKKKKKEKKKEKEKKKGIITYY